MSCKPCGPNISAGPKPYYEEVECHVTQCHETVLSHTEHAAGVLLGASWNVPGEDVVLSLPLPDVSVLSAGMYLYNPQYGYFLISHWNPVTKHVGLSNPSIAGTAAPGTFVPQYTPFYVTPKPCCEDDESTIFPFVESNFIAPLVGQSETVEVTSTFGLTAGSLIRIGTAIYRLDAINSTRQIVVFNQGAGFTPGSTVDAFDTEGELQYLIISEVATVCSAEAETNSGRLIICEGGDQKILAGNLAGRVPIVTGLGGVVEFQLVGTNSLDNAAVNTSKIATGAVTTSTLAEGAVTNIKIANGVVSTVKIEDGAVTTAKIAEGAVTNIKIANGVVSTVKIEDGAVTSAKIAANSISQGQLQFTSVGTANLITGAVTTPIIADGAVTTAKLAALAVSNATMANLVNSTSFTPVSLTTDVALGGGTLVGKYWTFGPFMIVYYALEINFFGNVTPHCDFELPVQGRTTDGFSVHWIGTVLSYGAATTSALQGSTVAPIINSGLPTDILRVFFRPGVTAANLNNLDMDCFAIYPFR